MSKKSDNATKWKEYLDMVNAYHVCIGQCNKKCPPNHPYYKRDDLRDKYVTTTEMEIMKRYQCSDIDDLYNKIAIFRNNIQSNDK